MSEEYQNLLVVFKLFKNRPHHLTKFLIENNAFKDDFIEKISDNDILENMSRNGITDDHLHFNNISEMKKYYSSLIDDLENLRKKKTKEELTIEINEKLQKAILRDDFEEACRIRDYMKSNNIIKL